MRTMLFKPCQEGETLGAEQYGDSGLQAVVGREGTGL